jgi:uridylate kinase
VDGVFTEDPEEHDDAERFLRIHGQEVIQRNLRVMDMTALTLCQESKMPIIVFNMGTPGNLSRLLRGETVGTRVHWDESKQDAERVPA